MGLLSSLIGGIGGGLIGGPWGAGLGMQLMGGQGQRGQGISGFGSGMGGAPGQGGYSTGFARNLFGGGNQGGGADGSWGSQYLNQIEPTLQKYYSPYINAGQQAMGTLMPQYQNLISNPTAMMNQIGSQYKASPGYQYNVDQATNASNQAAAAGGMVGSPAQQQSLAGTISGLASQDYNQFLQNALSQYGMGLQGMSGINQMGYGASTGMADNLAQALQSQAQLEYAKQANKQQQESKGGFLNTLTSLF